MQSYEQAGILPQESGIILVGTQSFHMISQYTGIAGEIGQAGNAVFDLFQDPRKGRRNDGQAEGHRFLDYECK
ncbi:MAG: hypothetical protein WC379_11215 [Methanoregula sp.]|jgi:hypothetical protein